MEDDRIVDLFWRRSEDAVKEASSKYGQYLYGIAYGILSDAQDAEECVNDTYCDAWETIPPHRPSVLSTFLGKITRRISIDLWRKNCAEKRGGSEIAVALDELDDCVSGSSNVEEEVERKEMTLKINAFLVSLPDTERGVFLCRYWYFDSVSSIAKQFGFSESKITSMLHRTRAKLRVLLEKEGY